MDDQVIGLGARLTEIMVRNSAGAVSTRLQASKAKRNDTETIAEMDEIISGLIEDKNEVVQIAQALNEKLVAQQISDTEIDYVTSNLVPQLEKLVELTSDGGDRRSQEGLDILKPLLSEETLRVLQLLGFNFKRAIGEPLTELLRGFILAYAPQPPSPDAQLLGLEHSLEAMRLVQNPEASARFDSWFRS